MKFKRIFLSLLFSIIICSCNFISLWASDYDFETTAVYNAPKSRVKALVKTTGYVCKDADLATYANIVAKIIFEKNITDTFQIITNRLVITSVKMNGYLKPLSDTGNYTANIFKCAEWASIKKITLDSIEIAELADVILATGLGPKGTHFKGQTNFITVDTVFHKTKFR